MNQYTSLEICAGAGGQALGLEQAGFQHLALVEIESLACKTLKSNRPNWNVLNENVRDFSAKQYLNKVDLLAGGVPCPPFSVAGKQLGSDDERDLFPDALRLVKECMPRAVLLENVRGLMDPKFNSYREAILEKFQSIGYIGDWKVLNASDHGVPQLRPRAILIMMRQEYAGFFKWPKPSGLNPPSVGEILYPLMKSEGWAFADEWREKATGIAPTLVGGSKKHGGADLGPTRAKKAWAALGVDGHGLANHPPKNDFAEMPKLTMEMAALIQGFPNEWKIEGKKTPAYRQVGNAFPPPVAKALGLSIIAALEAGNNLLGQTLEITFNQLATCKDQQKDKVQKPDYASTL